MSRVSGEANISSAKWWGVSCVLGLLLTLIVLKGKPLILEVAFSVRQVLLGVCLLEEMDIKGAIHTTREDIARVGHLRPKMPLLDVDTHQLKTALEKLPWIDTAYVKRFFPGKIVIGVREHTPFGLWDVGGKSLLVSETGGVINAPPPQKSVLYRLWGAETPKYALAFIKQLSSLDPVFARHIYGLRRLPSGRFDVYLKNGLQVCLPREGVRHALDQWRRLKKKTSLTSYKSVDLRVKTRVTLSPLPNVTP